MMELLMMIIALLLIVLSCIIIILRRFSFIYLLLIFIYPADLSLRRLMPLLILFTIIYCRLFIYAAFTPLSIYYAAAIRH